MGSVASPSNVPLKYAMVEDSPATKYLAMRESASTVPEAGLLGEPRSAQALVAHLFRGASLVWPTYTVFFAITLGKRVLWHPSVSGMLTVLSIYLHYFFFN
jgi:hypothetical protein